MSKLEKLLEKIKNNPKSVRFDELDRILTAAGFVRRQPKSGSSHYVYQREEKTMIGDCFGEQEGSESDEEGF